MFFDLQDMAGETFLNGFIWSPSQVKLTQSTILKFSAVLPYCTCFFTVSFHSFTMIKSDISAIHRCSVGDNKSIKFFKAVVFLKHVMQSLVPPLM